MLRLIVAPLFLAAFLLSMPIQSLAREINVLVIAIDGVKTAQQEWQPTIDYLQQHVSGHHFNLIAVVPGEIDRIEQLISDGMIDFVIAQPAIYVELEQNQGVSKILTLESAQGQAEFGSVLVAKTGSGILALQDLKGKRVAGVSALGFGGWLIGYNEMLESGFDPYKSANEVMFLGTQEKVLRAVLDGKADAGVLRTGILEKFFKTNQLRRQDVHILNEKHHEGFGELVSTELYPEWAFARTRKVNNNLAGEVAMAALSIPKGGEVARKGRYWMWTLPYDYQPVHRLMKKLGVGPYVGHGKVTVAMVYQQYKYTIFLAGALTAIILIMSLVILRYNQILLKGEREKQAIHDKTVYMATHDELTQMPNRRLFYELLLKMLQMAKRERTKTAILFLDLDGFKKLNDEFGHNAGDRILRLVAKAIMKSIRESDCAARLGGDEFVCALPGIKTLEEVQEIVDKIIARIRNISLPGGDADQFGASVGLLIAGPEHADPDSLIKQADDLMYAAKQAGKGRCVSKILTG
jgi:diguanylate cyclase (GGDEF)-like protein